MFKTVLLIFVCLLRFGALLSLQAESSRIYEHRYYWEYPEPVSPQSSDLFFADPVSSHFTGRSHYFTGLTVDGYVYIINIFRWKFLSLMAGGS
jgi:hypothetical protein